MRLLRTTHLTLIAVLLLSSTFADSANAQTGTWQDVEYISPGAQISVLLGRGHRFHCEFEYATDDHLVCDSVEYASVGRPTTFQRVATRQVHLEHPQDSALLGAAVGAGLGVASGVRLGRDPLARTVAAVSLGSLFGMAGHYLARPIPTFRATRIYER